MVERRSSLSRHGIFGILRRLMFVLLPVLISAILALMPMAVQSAESAKGSDQLSAEARLAMKSVSERYRKMKNWQADFSQETFSAGLGRGTFQTGTFSFADPALINFQVTGGTETSQFVSDGRQAWHLKYPLGRKKPAEGYHFANLSSIELSRYLIFLKGFDVSDANKEKKFLAEYKVSAKVDPSEIILTLEPKKSSEVSSVQLHFSQSKIPPQKIVLEDAIGNTTTVTLTKVTLDAKLTAQSFKPEIPRGSKILEK